MKTGFVSALTLSILLCGLPALAQHGHGSNSMVGDSGHAHGGSARSLSSTHGKTMDDLLTQNTKLSDKIASLTGSSAQQACSGFKNLGQCVSAAHVSKNLGISFACLKDDRTGTAPAAGSNCPAGTGTKAMSLGKSIQSLSPNANSRTETKKAKHQMNQDLKDSTTNS